MKLQEVILRTLARYTTGCPSSSAQPTSIAGSALRPFPADEMEAFEVSAEVGNVKNNSPELLNSK
jgi:hypothetical protein